MLSKQDNLKQQIEKGELSHAYLFRGNDSDYLYEKAINFARDIFQEKELQKKFDHHVLSDFLLVEPDNNIIKIEEIRGITSFLSRRPLESAFKIVLIKDADRMRTEGANALLKMLEEAPGYSIILLTSALKDQLLKTITSRCRVVDFFVKEAESLDFEKKELFEILEKSLNRELLELLFSKEWFKEHQVSTEDIFRVIKIFFMDLWKYKKTEEKTLLFFEENEEMYQKYQTISNQSLERIIRKINQVCYNLKYNVNYQLSCEELLLYIMEENDA